MTTPHPVWLSSSSECEEIRCRPHTWERFRWMSFPAEEGVLCAVGCIMSCISVGYLSPIMLCILSLYGFACYSVRIWRRWFNRVPMGAPVEDISSPPAHPRHCRRSSWRAAILSSTVNFLWGGHAFETVAMFTMSSSGINIAVMAALGYITRCGAS